MSAISAIVPRREQGLGYNLFQGVIIGIVLTALSYVVGIQANWITDLNYLEVFAVFTSYVCTFLCVMERRVNYPIGAASTAAYCVLFYQFGLLASSAINAFLVVYLIYGWFRWRGDSDTRPVTRMTLPSWGIHLLVAAVGYGIVVGIATLLGGTLAWTDSVILAGTILAQFMLDNKKLENWGVWAIVNVFAIYTYFTAGLPLAGFQYIFFLANTVYGFVMWQKSRKSVVPANIIATDDNVDLGDDPLDPHGDGTIREGDPMYDLMMGRMHGSGGIHATRNDDGTWKVNR